MAKTLMGGFFSFSGFVSTKPRRFVLPVPRRIRLPATLLRHHNKGGNARQRSIMEDVKPDRAYQQWCLEQAKRENVIVCLPTGAGKTRIAVRLLQHYQPRLALPEGVAVFLAPTVSLCMQQALVMLAAGLRTCVLASGSVHELKDKQPGAQGAPGSSTTGTADDDVVQAILDQQPRLPAGESDPGPRFDHALPDQVTVVDPRTLDHSASAAATPAKGKARKQKQKKAAAGGEDTPDASGQETDDDSSMLSDAPAEPEPGKKIGAGQMPRRKMQQVIRDHHVVVSTPGEMMYCLTHALLTVSKIHVMVLDEAHHVNAADTYGQILKGFVNNLPYQQRPRVLGLTATPLQALEREPGLQNGKQVLPDRCSLEKLTNARIIGANDWTEVSAMVPTPRQEVVEYGKPPIPEHGAMFDLLKRLQDARGMLKQVAELRRLRVLMTQQDALRKRLGGNAALAGCLKTSGDNVFEYLARQVTGLVASVEEMGLWTGLTMAQHTLFSYTESTLVMDLDPDLDIYDSDEEEDGYNASQTTAGMAGADTDDAVSMLSDDEPGSLRVHGRTRVRRGGDIDGAEVSSLARSSIGLMLHPGRVSDADSHWQNLMLRHRHKRAKLEKELWKLISKADKKSLKAKYGAALKRKGAGTSQRFSAELETLVAKEALLKVLTALSDNVGEYASDLGSVNDCLWDGDPQHLFIQDVGSVLDSRGLSGVMEGSLADYVAKLRPKPSVTQALLDSARLKDREQQQDPEKTIDYTEVDLWFTPKIRMLLDILLNPTRSDPGLDGGPGAVQGSMVFFGRKVYAMAVQELLTELPNASELGIKSSLFLGDTGQGSLSRSLGMSMLAQQRTMAAFSSGALNLLLATHVGAEGLDFGCCRRVILLDVPAHVVQMTQCKGRARMPASQCIILMPEGQANEQRQLEKLNSQEAAMVEVIKFKTSLFIESRAQAEAMPPPPPRFHILSHALPDVPDEAPTEEAEVMLPTVLEPAAPAQPAASRQAAAAPSVSRAASTGAADPPAPSQSVSFVFTAGNDSEEGVRPAASQASGVRPAGQRAGGGAGQWGPQAGGAQPAVSHSVADSQATVEMEGSQEVDSQGRGGGVTSGLGLTSDPIEEVLTKLVREVVTELPPYDVPETGARCTTAMAEQVLQAYCSSLPGNDLTYQLKPDFLTSEQGSAYRCTVVLPSNSRASGGEQTALMYTGQLCTTPSMARASAALVAVRMLHREKLLDNYLQPTDLVERLTQQGGLAAVTARLVREEITGFVRPVKVPGKLAHVLKPTKASPAKTATPAMPQDSQATDLQSPTMRHVQATPAGSTVAGGSAVQQDARDTASSPADTAGASTRSRSRTATASPTSRSSPRLTSPRSTPSTQPSPAMSARGQRNTPASPALLPTKRTAAAVPLSDAEEAAPEPLNANALTSPATSNAATPARVSPTGTVTDSQPSMYLTPRSTPGSQQGNTVTRHLYGWVVQPCALPEPGARGPLSATIYTFDGPWPVSPSLKTPPNSQRGTPAGAVSPAAIAIPATAACSSTTGGSSLMCFGVLLPNALPPNALPPYSIWLPGGVHALVAVVHLRTMQLTQEELAALHATHNTLSAMACMKRLKAKVKTDAAAPTATGKATGAKAPPTPAGAVGLQQPSQQAPQQQGTTTPPPAAPSQPETPQLTRLQVAYRDWCNRYGLGKLRASLQAVGYPVQPSQPVDLHTRDPPVTAQDPWYFVVPVTMCAPQHAGKKRRTTTPGTPAQQARPTASGEVDWELLTRLAAGPVSVQDMLGSGSGTAAVATTPVAASAGQSGGPAATSTSTWGPRPRNSGEQKTPDGCAGQPAPTWGPAPKATPPQPSPQQSSAPQQVQAGGGAGTAQALGQGLVEQLTGRLVFPAHAHDARMVCLGLAQSKAKRTADSAGTPAEGADLDVRPATVEDVMPLQGQFKEGSYEPASLKAQWHKMYDWLQPEQYSHDAPLLVAEVGTTRFIRRNLTQAQEVAEAIARQQPEPKGKQQRQKRRSEEMQVEGGSNQYATRLRSLAQRQALERRMARRATAAAGLAPAAEGGQAAPVQGAAGAAGAAQQVAAGAATLPDVQQDVSVQPATGAAAGQPGGSQTGTAAPATTAAVPQRQLVLPDGAKASSSTVLFPAATLVNPLTLAEWGALAGLPALMRRLQVTTSVQEWRDVVMPHISPRAQLPVLRDLIVSFTPPRCNEPYNYEGAEILGDCVLDYLAAVYLFHALPNDHEGVLTECKIRLVANEVLLRLTASRRHNITARENSQVLGDGAHQDTSVTMDQSRMQLSRSMRRVARGAVGMNLTDTSKWTAVLPLQPYVQAKPFDSAWEWTRGGDLSQQNLRGTKVRGKVMGDVVEAIVGTAFLSHGGAEALGMATVLDAEQLDHNRKCPDKIAGMCVWNMDKLTHALIKTAALCEDLQVLPGCFDVLAAVHRSAGVPPRDLSVLKTVEEAVRRAPASAKEAGIDQKLADQLVPMLGGYAFRRPELLREALTHVSYPVPPCNQRLEFLGDTALDIIVTLHLANAATHAATKQWDLKRVHGIDVLSPAAITDQRNRLVSNRHLSILCARCKLHHHMRANPQIKRQVRTFEAQLVEYEERIAAESDEEQQKEEAAHAAGEEYVRKRHKYGQSTGAPKLLADLVEAVLGAVLIDSGGDLVTVWRVLWGLVEQAGMQAHYLFLE